MKKIYPVILFVIISSITNVAQIFGQCPSYITLYSQAEVDNFAINYQDCVSQGWLTSIILDGSDIIDLSGLSSITTITDKLNIQNARNFFFLWEKCKRLVRTYK